jgi:peptidoglycan/LPS O-acetylase OafA/YrhL
MVTALPTGIGGPDVERERRDNNFDALRIIAALLVIVGHSFVLTGREAVGLRVGALPLEYIGVSTFFVISGYLITGSWERSRNVGQYVSSRALRIAPLLWAVVLVSAFVMGPFVTVLTPGEYFSSPEFWRYLVNLVLLPADGLPGVFGDVPYPGVVNGSVWTLRAEVICYALVLGLGFLPRMAQLVGFTVFGVAGAWLVIAGPVIVAGSSVSAAGGTWVFFAVGALVRLVAPRRLFHPVAGIIVLAVWIALEVLMPAWAYPMAWIALPYIVLAIGFASTPVVRRTARFGDLSYGLYLWAFPVQQLVVSALPGIPHLLDIVIVTAITACLAFASWHLLEKRALAARFRLPWFQRPKHVPMA